MIHGVNANHTVKTISVIVPTLNERENIVPLVERIGNALDGIEYEIVFVDDDSKDGTKEAIDALSVKYPIQLVVRHVKSGLSSAVMEGVSHAAGDSIVVMDADLQHPPEVVPALVEKLREGADIVVASRYVKGGACPDWGLTRKIISRVAVLLAHLVLPTIRKVKDPTSGFFAFKKDVIKGVNIKPSGFKILMEILVIGKAASTSEVPFSFDSRQCGKSKLGIRQEWDYLEHLVSLAKRKGELYRFLKFCAVGASGVVVNLGILWLLTELSGLYYLLSNAISIELSIVSNFMLNDAFTFSDRRSGGSRKPGRLLKFNIISLAGLGLNLAVVWVCTSVLGIYYIVSAVFGIAVAIIWNYIVNQWWTWK